MNSVVKSSLIVFLLLKSIISFAQLQIQADNKAIRYSGRVSLNKDQATFYWPGSAATIHFIGTGLKARMQSLKEKAYFYAILDNNMSSVLKIEVDQTKKEHTLAENLPQGKHSLQLYKLTNSTSANILYGFSITGKAKLRPATKAPKRKIEFYGNSITAGHGVDVQPGMKDSGQIELFNNYYTYAALTSRHFNAEASIIARSGIGIMLSWFPEIMPEVYDRLDPFDTSSKWNFSTYTPDIVVINLFQNDSWLINKPEHAQFKNRFGNQKPTEDFIIKSYREFVQSIRSKYPKAEIICALGNMDATEKASKWPLYIQQAVQNLSDPKIHTLFFPYKNTTNHPNRQEQQTMADQLIKYIENHIKW